MITLSKLIEKFEDKGFDTSIIFFNLPLVPLFDPSCLELQYSTKEDLYDIFKRSNAWRFKFREDRLEELNTWIDHQNYK